MSRTLILSLVVVAALVCVQALNEGCNESRDCPDAGTTCVSGRCICWTDRGPIAADAWSCDDDRKCERSFPGHACRPSEDCVPTRNRMGYCQPR